MMSYLCVSFMVYPLMTKRFYLRELLFEYIFHLGYLILVKKMIKCNVLYTLSFWRITSFCIISKFP